MFSMLKMSIISTFIRFIIRFNLIPIKILAAFFYKYRQVDSKIYKEQQKIQNS